MCCKTTTPTPIPAELTNLTLCKGRDVEGVPIAFPDIIPPTEQQICICGDLKVDEESYLQVLWNYEREDLQKDVVKWGSGPVTNCVIKNDGFTPGNYGVVIFYGRALLGVIDFNVREKP